MNYATICSGIECFSAGVPATWRPQFFAEIENYCCSVLRHHYPGVPNHGDITKFKDWPDHAIDLLCGGTPCQSFSLAGLRSGLRDPRGSLMLTYLAIAGRYRPKWLVWENVPGALSTHAGRDFGTFLGGLAELGYGAAWRVLDAQFVRVDTHPRAVPQRRRRLFVVGHIGDDWRRAGAVLFERESLSWDPAPSRETGETVTGEITGDDGSDYCGGFVPAIVRQAISSKWSKRSSGPAGDEVQNLVADPIVAREGKTYSHEGSNNFRLRNIVSGLRRLTPLEVERLMGLPDGYTAIRYKGKPAADATRYRALGNGMAVNCVRWICQRIDMVEGISDHDR